MRKKRSIDRPRLHAVVIVTLLLSCLFVLSARAAASPAALPGNSIYNIASEWTTQDGKALRLESLRGHPVVLAMIYLNCPDVCPLIAENMQRIEVDLPKKRTSSGVRFALFSFDSARDSAERLKAYASARGLDPQHWTLYRSSDMAARELAAALDLTFRRADDGNFDHSVAILLLDADGVVVYRQIGLKQDTQEFVSRLKAMELGQ